MVRRAAAEAGLREAVGYWGELDGRRHGRATRRAPGSPATSVVDGAIGSRTAALRGRTPTAGHRGHALPRRRAGRRPRRRLHRGRAPGRLPRHRRPRASTTVAGLRRPPSRARRADARRGGRHRLEHVEMPSPDDDARRSRELGVIASVQPCSTRCGAAPTGMYAERLGRAWRGDEPVRVARPAPASRWPSARTRPVTPLDPWGAVRAAVHHHDRAERMTVRGGVRRAHPRRLARGPPRRRRRARRSAPRRPRRLGRAGDLASDPDAGSRPGRPTRAPACRSCPTCAGRTVPPATLTLAPRRATIEQDQP